MAQEGVIADSFNLKRYLANGNAFFPSEDDFKIDLITGTEIHAC